jgi:Flp pilus assembly protein TadG
VVELAITLPLLLLLLAIATDLGRVFYYSLTVQNCARAGAVYAADPDVSHESPFANFEAAALADAPHLRPAPRVSSTLARDTQGNAYVEVTAEYQFDAITTLPGLPKRIDVSKTVRMYVASSEPDI